MIFITRFPYIVFNMNGSIIYYFSHNILGLDDKKNTSVKGDLF